MDVLWRDLAPAAAANNLHQAVHVARRALGADAIEVRDEVLSLSAEVDVDVFERSAADARRLRTAGAYGAALSLYGGELLPENRYDDWAGERREELAALAAELAEEAAALGDGSRFALPADASSFVGRGRELTELESLLQRTRLLTLSGTGGVGKTRLALELARAVESSYESGAALVELASVSEGSLVLDAVATALDVRPLAAQELVDAVIDFLAPRTLLLVLDNCEHLFSATAAVVDALLRGAPQLTILATSREPLRAAGEVVFRVPSLDIPDPEQPLDPRRLLDYEAVSLFVERAAAASPGFVARRGERRGRRPHLSPPRRAAARARARGRAARRAEHGGDRRAARRPLPPPAQRQPRRADASADADRDAAVESRPARAGRAHAAPAARRSSRAASSSRRSRTCARSTTSTRREIADTLARLVEKSLVAVEDGDRRNRYRLLETVRIYARAAARRRRRDDGARRRVTRAGRSRSPSASGTRRGSSASRRTCASHSTRCSRASRATRSVSASR